MKSIKYILVTTCRDEEENLPNLIYSIKAQTVKPVFWVIVNDGSTDGTPEIISKTEKKHEWIKGVHLKEQGKYMGKHYADVCNKGFEFAREYCHKNEITYNFVALVDADNILEKDYVEKLIIEFEKDSKLGIASGINAYAEIQYLLAEIKKSTPNASVMDEKIWNLYGSSLVQVQKSYEDKPMGSARLWRRKCFEETGNGYLFGYAPDSISNVKAKMRGWKTRRFMNARVIERRGTIKQGVWNGGIRDGKFDYFLGRPLYYSLLRAITFSLRKPHYFGLFYFYGYIASILKKESRIDDNEVLEYYQRIRPRELKERYIRKFNRYVGLFFRG